MGVGLWIVTATFGGLGVILLLFAHFDFEGFALSLYVFGSIFLALAVALGFLNVTGNAIVILGISVGLTIFLVGVEAFNWLGLRGAF